MNDSGRDNNGDDDDDDRTRINMTIRPIPDDVDLGISGTVPPPAGSGGYEPTQLSSVQSLPVSATVPPPIPAAPIPPVGSPTEGTGVHIGTMINNNYEVKQVLKAGGMGEVYRGENVYTGDPVAIKVVLPELAADEKTSLMFMREARTLSQLSDEAIVSYYNFVKDPVIDRFCLIMEFISGVPLSDHTSKQGPISVEDAQTLLRRLAKGLQKAHEMQVIHRDLSPDNVMLPEGIVSRAKLIDFGIAKSDVIKEATMAGQFAGKFKYVSPEQLGFYGSEIGPASDIYGLALLMAAAMVGKPLDMGNNIVLAVEARKQIPDVSAIPEEMRPLISYMLEPDPSDRPESMAEIVMLLDQPENIPEKHLAGLPLPPSMQTQNPMTQSGRTLTPRSRPPKAVAGLQIAPGTHSAMSDSSALDDDDAKSGGIVGKLVMLAVIAAIGGGGYYAYDKGVIDLSFIDQMLAKTETKEPVKQDEKPPSEEPVAASTNTRAGFLAAFDAGPCTLAARVVSGRNAGMIRGFAQAKGSFDGLPTAYEEKFGARPNVLDHQITDAQCAALDFTKALQGRNQTPSQLQVTPLEVHSGDAISGQLDDPDGRATWLVLVTPSGRVFNLTKRLTIDAAGTRQVFGFGLTLAEGKPSEPQLIMAVSSTDPLAAAAAARDGALAVDLLPSVLDEIRRKGSRATVSLSYLMLLPALPPEPEPEVEDRSEEAETEEN